VFADDGKGIALKTKVNLCEDVSRLVDRIVETAPRGSAALPAASIKRANIDDDQIKKREPTRI
jgi:hypothetical protein